MGRRVFVYLTAALIVLVALLAVVAWMPLRRAAGEWRGGRYADAIKTAQDWSQLRFWPRQYEQLLAASQLAAGNREGAEAHLRALRRGSLWISALPAPDVAKRLFARAAYADYLAYDDAVREPHESPRDRAHAQLALQKIAEAERAGRRIFAFDRKGTPLAANLVDVILSGAPPPPAVQLLDTTIDAEVQRLAQAAFGNERGALVAIDPRTNEILAIAGTAPHRQFEPGSVVKVLTLIAALANGVDVDKLFPYVCTGALEVDGRSFGDWRVHGTLSDMDEALAQSCNTVFADVGIRTGREKLHALHRSAGFDGQTNLGLFRIPLGRTVGEFFNDFEIAFYAIGLEHETVTAFHLAMLASMLANRGALTTPRLLRARRTIVGDVLAGPSKQSTTQVAPRAAVERAVAAMQSVVTRPQGTGRRAKIDGVTLALKTGTSGTRDAGYDTVVFGFAPAEQPKVAFAVFAENAGSAEMAGARIVKAFLEGMRDRGHL